MGLLTAVTVRSSRPSQIGGSAHASESFGSPAGPLAPESTLVDILRRHASHLIREFTADTMSFNELPQSILDADFVSSAQRNITLFFDYLADGVEPTPEATRPLIDRATELIHDGMSVAEALRNYREGARFLWSHLTPLLERHGPHLLSEFGSRLAGYLGLITARIAEALVADARRPRWEPLEHQHEIADALLSGRAPSDDPEIPLAAAYLVTVIRLGDAAPGTLTAVRRTLAAEPGTLLHRDASGWTALLPLTTDPLPPPLRRLTTGATIHDPTNQGPQPHPKLWLGTAAAPAHDAIPAAHREARIVADTARCLHLPKSSAAVRTSPSNTPSPPPALPAGPSPRC
ncbi:hypothetical protein NS14008_25060 [Nocardia seriolae]|nr:hypothetical protein NS14008_25060 [Nocardia seriolae]